MSKITMLFPPPPPGVVYLPKPPEGTPIRKPVFAMVGYSRSGKGMATKLLEARGFASYAGRDWLTAVAKSENIPTDRTTLIWYANKLRAEKGADYLVQAALDYAVEADRRSDQRGLVVDSLRNPGEVRFLQEKLGAYVVDVWATDEVRWDRTQKAPKEGDPENIISFIGLTAIDQGYGQAETGQNIKACVEMADVHIENNRTPQELAMKIDELLISRGIEAPHRQEYF